MQGAVLQGGGQGAVPEGWGSGWVWGHCRTNPAVMAASPPNQSPSRKEGSERHPTSCNPSPG